jgi:hypothetical protein
MPQETYQRILLERAHSRHRWENEVADVTIDALDTPEIRRTIQTGIASGRLPADTSADDLTDVLDRLGLRLRGAFVNAAVVVFGRNFLPHYPQCQLRLARFRGVDKDEFLDQRQLHGHAFSLLSEAMQFLTRHLPVAGRVEAGLFERVDEPLFPPIALREALVNAFCHRDYAQAGGAVSVAIYDDRLEIWSSGGLPSGIEVEDLKREHLSRPRNPLIAEVFYRGEDWLSAGDAAPRRSLNYASVQAIPNLSSWKSPGRWVFGSSLAAMWRLFASLTISRTGSAGFFRQSPAEKSPRLRISAHKSIHLWLTARYATICFI